ncbi:hypothetical protein BSP75_05100 [Aeromonas sp. YN13HZO-058]|nr:hypothetical protein BSP75_05100 [Aeromonas sp. YN13HZO-058]
MWMCQSEDDVTIGKFTFYAPAQKIIEVRHWIPMALDFIGVGGCGGKVGGWLAVEEGLAGAIPLCQSAL